MIRPLVLAALLGLVACAESEPPDATPAEDDGAYNMIDPVRTGVVEEGTPAIGEWARSLQEEQPALTFGPTGAEPLFSLRCDDREGVLVHRHGLVETGAAGMMTLVLGAESHQLAVNPVEAPLPMLRAAVAANDPLLAAIAAHQGSLRLVVGEGPPLVLPASPMIGAFIENCAAGEVPPIGAAGAADAAAGEGAAADNASAPVAEPSAR